MSGFVTRSGTQLLFNGSPFRFAGCNIYWLGAFDNPPAYPTHFEMDDALNTAKEMGMTCIRSHGLGISLGYPVHVWPSLYATNSDAFESIDYAIWKAGTLGLKLIIPLMDDHSYPAGGKPLLVSWVNAFYGLTNLETSSYSAFYNDPHMISAFKTYIALFLNRINQYTGLAYKDDPTIMCWETGNEYENPQPPTTWTGMIATYIKSLAPNHLVMDGTGLTIVSANLSLADVDIYTNHYYPLNITNLTNDANTVYTGNKVFLCGEFDWTPNVGGVGNVTATVDTAASPPDGSNAAKVAITTQPTQNYYMQLQQGPITMVSGHTYSISFYAKAGQSCSPQVIFQSSNTGFVQYASMTASVTTSWKQFSFTNFVAPLGDTNVYIRFNLGVAATNIWIDQVVILDVTAANGTNLVTNPSFESSTSALTGWTLNLKATDSLPAWLASVEGNPKIQGDLFWSLFPHKFDKNFHTHGDIYTMYYPNGLSSDQAARMQQLRSHFYRMNGKGVTPAGLPGPQTVTVTAVSTTSLQWAGVAGALQYLVEVATSSSGPWTFAQWATDAVNPITVALTGKWYRVTTQNVDGVLSEWSVIGNATGSGPTSVYTPRNQSGLPAATKSGLVYPAASGLS